MLRVCVVSPLYHTSLGGVGGQALALTEKLGSFGVIVFAIARKMKRITECISNSHIPVYRVRAFRPQIINLVEMSLLNFITSLSFSLSTALLLFRKRKDYDIVHFHGASLPLITNILLLKLYGKKVIAKVAAANVGTEAGSLQGRYSLLGKILIWMLKQVDSFIATSEEIEQGLLRDGYDRAKIVRIPNSVDPNIFYPSARESREKMRKDTGFSDETIVTFTGRLVDGKGIDTLLAAWEKLPVDLKNTYLFILGEGPLENQLKNQCRELGIEGKVKFTGLVHNVRKYLAISDIYVFPSFQEGFPNSVLEAMACGLPVIASRIGGVMDMINRKWAFS
jgi:glycosyltransferase involved in cell wall biosynthesis